MVSGETELRVSISCVKKKIAARVMRMADLLEGFGLGWGGTIN